MKHIFFWRRYVDDVLCLFTGTDSDLEQFFNYLNSCHNNINFTLEKENNKQINYLDLNISRKNHKLEYSIYHKPTATDTTINATSYQHPQTKTTPFIYYVDRLISIPMSGENFEKELNHIKHLAVKNDFKPDLIDKLVRRRLRKRLSGNDITVERKEDYWCAIPYIGNLSNKIGQILNKAGIRLAYKRSQSLGDYLSNLKDPIDMLERSGVYKIQCGVCSSIYIGQTGRKLGQRYKEHFRKSQASEFRSHLEKAHHHSGEHTVSLVHTQRKGKSLNVLEAMEIKLEKAAGALCLNHNTDLVEVGLADSLSLDDILRLPVSRAQTTRP